MGGSLQCDLCYATFHIGNKSIRIEREPRVNHILGGEIGKDSTCFLNTSVNSFRDELFIQEVEKFPFVITHEVECCMDSPILLTMYFDGASSKEGSGARVVFVFPKKNTFRYSFTLNFSCTKNIAEYEALL